MGDGIRIGGRSDRSLAYRYTVSRRRKEGKLITVFVVCLGFWLLLSGHYSPLSVALGVVSAGLVAWVNRGEEALSGMMRSLPGLLAYLPWLLGQIVVSNLEVARLVLDPRLPIDPVVIRFKPPPSSDLAATVLANSITLTPGTVTLEIADGEFVVHALTAAAGAALVEGPMARRVARAFGEAVP